MGLVCWHEVLVVPSGLDGSELSPREKPSIGPLSQLTSHPVPSTVFSLSRLTSSFTSLLIHHIASSIWSSPISVRLRYQSCRYAIIIMQI